MYFYVYCPNDHIGTVLLFCFRLLIGQNKFFAKYGAKMGKTASHLDGHQHAFPNYFQAWHDTDVSLNQFKFMLK